MSIKPMIRDNIALNAHPIGCKQNILNQIHELKDFPMISDKPLNVLIVGGSSGYGLASRIVLTYKANAYTYNVSFERAPRGRNTGSAGYYNNHYFTKIARQDGHLCDDLNGDAFSFTAKETVIDHFRSLNKKIDLVVYSVASGIRIDPFTQIKYLSTLKPIGSTYSGYNVDIANESLRTESLEPASEDEIANTVKVMGGEDFILWAKALKDADILNEGVKFITYTYLGSPLTHPIYRDGTIGQAKRDLEKANETINELLAPLHGKSIISASKAVATKASVFIPTMVLYASALFKVMKELGSHESTVEHKYRLFKDMVYGDKKLVDKEGFYRVDALEMDDEVQNRVNDLLEQVNQDNFRELLDFVSFKHEFLAINGFDIDGVDYEAVVEEI